MPSIVDFIHRLVRVGNLEQIHAHVRKYCLDTIVDSGQEKCKCSQVVEYFPSCYLNALIRLLTFERMTSKLTVKICRCFCTRCCSDAARQHPESRAPVERTHSQWRSPTQRPWPSHWRGADTQNQCGTGRPSEDETSTHWAEGSFKKRLSVICVNC